MDRVGLFFKCSVLHHEHFYLAYIGRFAVNTFVHKFINAGMNLSSSSMAESIKMYVQCLHVVHAQHVVCHPICLFVLWSLKTVYLVYIDWAVIKM